MNHSPPHTETPTPEASSVAAQYPGAMDLQTAMRFQEAQHRIFLRAQERKAVEHRMVYAVGGGLLAGTSLIGGMFGAVFGTGGIFSRQRWGTALKGAIALPFLAVGSVAALAGGFTLGLKLFGPKEKDMHLFTSEGAGAYPMPMEPLSQGPLETKGIMADLASGIHQVSDAVLGGKLQAAPKVQPDISQ